jgi:indole-3-glycerol phosphate synthase
VQNIDVGAIVPSTRDLLQVISTRRKSMALIALLGPEAPAEEAARLHELNISALAFAEAGPAMQLGARATKTVPSLCLTAVRDREVVLAARFHGADGVCVDALLPLDDWDRVAKGARTMRMLPLALAESAEGAANAIKAGARAILLRGASADAVLAAAASVPRTLTIVADVAGVDAVALRSLFGRVDAAIIPPALHTSPEFAAFVAEVDP